MDRRRLGKRGDFFPNIRFASLQGRDVSGQLILFGSKVLLEVPHYREILDESVNLLLRIGG